MKQYPDDERWPEYPKIDPTDGTPCNWRGGGWQGFGGGTYGKDGGCCG